MKKNGSKSLPTSRIVVFDAAKFLTIFLMMSWHTLDALAQPHILNRNVFPWNIWNLVGPTSSLYLTISGLVFTLTAKPPATHSQKLSMFVKKMKKAISVALFGYIAALPFASIWQASNVAPERWTMFFSVGILPHVAVVLTLLTIISLMITSYRRQIVMYSIFAACFAIFSPLVHSLDWFTIVPEWLGMFFSFQRGSIFPLFPFGAYMFAGAVLGVFLKHKAHEERSEYLRHRFFFVGSALLLVGNFLTAYDDVISSALPHFFPAHNVIQSSPWIVLLRLGFVLLTLSVVERLTEHTARIHSLYIRFGRKSLYLYSGHLVLIFGTPWFGSLASRWYHSLSFAESFSCALGIIVVMLSSAYMLDIFEERHPIWSRRLRYTFYCVIVVLFLVPPNFLQF